jgi:hypothetical protein
MKTFSFLITYLTLFAKITIAQLNGNAIIFAEKGERFVAILNGIRQNQEFQSNIKLNDLNGEFYKLKILFQNPAAKAVNLNLYVKRGFETTYNLKRNTRGKYVLRFISEAPIHLPPPPNPSPVFTNPSSLPNGTNVNNGTQINVPVNVNVNVGGNQVVAPVSSVSPANGNVPVYNGMPMTNTDFQSAKKTISDKNFDDSKLQIAKQIAGSNNLLASQIKEIMQLFSFEDSRLDFAKFAYKNCINKGNYFEVNQAFSFDSSVDNLNQFILSFK